MAVRGWRAVGPFSLFASVVLLAAAYLAIQVGNRTLRYRHDAPLEADVYSGETNRPELFVHSFGPLGLSDPDDGVFIFHKGRNVLMEKE